MSFNVFMFWLTWGVIIFIFLVWIKMEFFDGGKKKQIRNEFRKQVFERDNYTCKVCLTKRPEDALDAHHVMSRDIMPNGGYVPENGITVLNTGIQVVMS